MHIRATLAALLATAAVASATPTGLNNIPTADTTPQGVFVLQAFTTLGPGALKIEAAEGLVAVYRRNWMQRTSRIPRFVQEALACMHP